MNIRGLMLSHVGLFLIAWLILRQMKALRGAAAIICALMLATSATPVFGIAVLHPLLGDTSTGTVGLVALAINFVVPLAVILLEAQGSPQGGHGGALSSAAPAHGSPVVSGIKSGCSRRCFGAPCSE